MSNNQDLLIIGLGNPGEKYSATRHNIGFMAVEIIASKYSIEFQKKNKFHGQFGEINNKNFKIKLLLPNTYMNESGKSVRATMDWLGYSPDQILVIFDDMDIPFGKLRIRNKGSSGGHNGIKSIINHVGSDEFCRLKIGIGSPQQPQEDKRRKAISHVLGPFNTKEKVILDKILLKVYSAVDDFKFKNLQIIMNEINTFDATIDKESIHE
mgnify:CR=1 FL=1